MLGTRWGGDTDGNHVFSAQLIRVTLERPLKLPMLVTELPIVTLTRVEQPSKAASPILVITMRHRQA